MSTAATDRAKRVACRVAIDILVVELYRAERKHLRARSRRILDHDAEVTRAGGSGQSKTT